MRRAPCTIVLLLCVFLPDLHGLAAQTGSMRVSLPSPTAASLGKFGDVPVSLHSGLPEVLVPLFTARGRTLELPIALRYQAGGIRVQEIGGWAGIGWTLEAGGAVTRTVRGIVDETTNGYYNTGHTFYAAGNWSSPSNQIIDAINQNTLDGEPDQFFFNFMGRSGQFVIGPTDSTGFKEVRTIPYQRLDIQPHIAASRIDSVTITAEDGTRYRFAAREMHTDYSTSSPGDQIPGNYGEAHASSWHLTEIRSPGGDVITLHYTEYVARYRLGTYIEKFDQRVSSPGESCVPSQFETTTEYEVKSQRLDSIRAAAHTVHFIPDTNLRADALSPTGVSQEPRLASIVVTTPGGAVLRTFDLDHDYFSGDRLRLRSVSERAADGTSLPPYTFTYSAQSFPDLASTAQDHWGYYNARSNSTLIPAATTPTGQYLTGADRSPDPSAMKVGSLIRITYPTGGFTEFAWEANDYGGIGSQDEQPQDLGDPQSEWLGSSDFEGLKSTTFTIGGSADALVDVHVTLGPSDCGEQVGCPWAELTPNGGLWTAQTSTTLSLAPGTYTLRAYSDLANGFANIQVSWREPGPVLKKIAGGLRIAEVRTGDAMGNMQVRRYRYTRESEPDRSSGVINAEPRYDYFFNSGTCSYFSRSSTSKMPLGGGAPVSYTEVTVLHGASGEFGRRREAFRSVRDAADGTVTYEMWPYSRVTSSEWKRGQRIESAEYNDVDQIQRRERAGHAFQDGDTVSTREFLGISLNAFSGGRYGGVYIYNPFKVVSAWTHPAADTIYIYDESGSASVSTTRRYAYGNWRHAQLTELTETNSDGTERITYLKYPADYEAGSGDPEAAALTAMQGAAHMHSPVIERLVTERSGSSHVIVQAELTTFRAFGAGRYLPYQRFVLNTASPVQ